MDQRLVREGLVGRLRARSQEIEAAIMGRVLAVSETAVRDPDYMAGLHASVCSAIDIGLATIEDGREEISQVPPALLSQARSAARLEVSLETVLRRYFAGYTLLLDFILAEAREDALVERSLLQAVLRCQGIVHEEVVAAVSDEYAREVKRQEGKGVGHRARIVRRILAGETLDVSHLGYRLDAPFHIGAVTRGDGAVDLIRAFAERHHHHRLTVSESPEDHWIWLAASDVSETREMAAELRRDAEGKEILIALGEPSGGVAGWKLTHRQARAAMSVATRGPESVVRYTDVALTASLLQDELLADSLRRLYLEPLAEERDGGEGARRILRAFFRTGRNVSSAAAHLRINRQTMSKRLKAIDERLDSALTERSADLEVALRLEEITHGR